MASRVKNVVSGFADILRFSNRFGLIFQRLFQKKNPIVHYVWKGKWHLYCHHRFGDHGSVKEVLAQGAYGRCLAKVCQSSSFTYVNVGAFDIAIAACEVDVPYACGIELNPWTFSRLAFNVSANGLYSVRLVNVGIAGKPGIIPFSPRKGSVTDCIFNEVPESAAAVQNVELDTLDSVLNKVSLSDKIFDLLKLDAEGAVYGIIESLEASVLGRFRRIVMEFHKPPGDAKPEAIYEKLAACGFVSGEPKWTAGSRPELRMWSRA